MRRTYLSLSLAALLLTASTGFAQMVTDVELGYRFTNITGNEDMYRSQINEREGFLLRGLTLQTADFGGKLEFIDQFRLDATDLFAGPSGSLRLEAVREGTYKFRFSYTHREHYSALPEFANPLLSQGIIPGQHTFDRDRDTYDAELEILPGKVITPIIGYTYSMYRGPGRTTYFLGQDEFHLNSHLDDSEQEIRGGIAFNAGPVSGQFIQGWRKYNSDDSLTLVPGTNAGNNSLELLGTDTVLNTYTRTTSTESTAPVTNAVVTARLFDSWRLTGLYVRAKDDLDATDRESATGIAPYFPLNRYIKGWDQSVTANSINTYWRGAGRLEGKLFNMVDLSAGFARRENTLEGTALIDSLTSLTTTFTQVDPKDIRVLIDANGGVERTEDTFDVQAAARHLGPFGIRLGYAQVKQDLMVDEDVSQIVIPGGQEGSYSRKIDRIDGALSFALAGFSLSANIKSESADEPVMRTDFLDRQTFRFRAGYRMAEIFEVFGVYQDQQVENDRAGYNYDASVRDWRAGFSVTPIKAITAGFNYGEYEGESRIPIRMPYNNEPPNPVVNSYQEENGTSWEASLIVRVMPVKIEGAYGEYENEGTFGIKMKRARVLADIDFTKVFGIAGEWCWDKYEETTSLPAYGNYDANRFGVFLKIHP